MCQRRLPCWEHRWYTHNWHVAQPNFYLAPYAPVLVVFARRTFFNRVGPAHQEVYRGNLSWFWEASRRFLAGYFFSFLFFVSGRVFVYFIYLFFIF